MTEPIRFDGWWGEEDRAECPEPWERFTVMVHGEEAGDYREATVEDLILAGFVPLKDVEKVARWHFSGMLPSDERAELEVDVFMRRLRQQMGGGQGQRRIYETIASLESELGYAPTLRQIAERAGLRSTSTVHAHLQRLLQAGLIRRASRTVGYTTRMTAP